MPVREIPFRRAIFVLGALAALAGPGAAQTQDYTVDVDFDRGTLVNVNHADYADQLQLNRKPEPLPFIWIAVSAAGTAVKIDVDTGAVLGEYYTSPEGMARNPSRTTVDHYGNVWVGNRDEDTNGMGSLFKVGTYIGGTRGYPDPGDPTRFIAEPAGPYVKDPFYNQCEDRNGDGLIRTSTGYGDVLPWPQVADGPGSVCDASQPDAGVRDAEDECILLYQRVHGTRVRHLSVDQNNDIWVGGYANNVFDLLAGETGCILRTESPGCGGYGGLTDCYGRVWSSNPKQGTLLTFDPATGQYQCLTMPASYGLGIDSKGFIWNTLYTLDQISKIDPATGAVLFTVSVDPAGVCEGVSGRCGTARACPTGMAVRPQDDSVWTANRFCDYKGLGYASATRLDSFGNVRKIVPLLDPGTGATGLWPSGVAVDGYGYVWINNIESSNIMRIDPNGGMDGLGEVDLTIPLSPDGHPYDYSDMSGITALTNPPFGFWSFVRETGCEQTAWESATWNRETPLPAGAVHEPSGTSIRVEVRSAATPAGLTSQPFVDISNGVPFGPLPGRYIEVRVNFEVEPGNYCADYGSPILTDLTLHARLPAAAVAGPDNRVCLGDSVTLSGAASTVAGCAGSVEYRWSWPGHPGAWTTDPAVTLTPAATTTCTVEVRCSTEPDCVVRDEVVVVVDPCPSAVEFAWYRAAPSSAGTRVAWATLSERDTLGFTVYRRDCADGPEVPIHAGFVAAAGAGRSYEVVDPAAIANRADARYRVVETATSGPGDATPWFGLADAPDRGTVDRSRSPRRAGVRARAIQ